VESFRAILLALEPGTPAIETLAQQVKLLLGDY